MSGFTDEAAKQKLATLNETHEGIVGVAQWFLFHRRHAERTVQLWYELLNASGAAKRLNLIYLANELVQQSKNKRREEFLNAFSMVIADATAAAYKSASNEVQNKLRRTLEVWRQRSIFDTTTQDSIEARIDALDKDKSSGRRPLFSGSLFSNSSSSIPTELAPLAPLQNTLSKAELTIKPALSTATSEYDALTDSSKPAPSPPVHAAKLSQLLKSLANAEGAVTETLKARHSLIEALEKILTVNREKAETEQRQHADLHSRRQRVEDKKKEVEDAIMNGLGADDANAPATLDADRWERPEVEELTPPAESFTPPGEPSDPSGNGNMATIQSETTDLEDPLTSDAATATHSISNLPSIANPVDDAKPHQTPSTSLLRDARPASPQPDELPEFHGVSTYPLSPSAGAPPPGLTEALSVLASSASKSSHPRPDSAGSNSNANVGVKRRRTDAEFEGFGNDGLDEETVGMLS